MVVLALGGVVGWWSSVAGTTTHIWNNRAFAFLTFMGLLIAGGVVISLTAPRPEREVHAKLDAHTKQLTRIEELLSRPPQWGATGPQGPLNPETTRAAFMGTAALAEGHASVSFGGRGIGTATPGPQGPTGPVMPPSPFDKSDDDPQPDR
jgi:hypothetical protein